MVDEVDSRDTLLHAVVFGAMNCGMRFDEIAKVTMSNSSCAKYDVTFGIGESTKNSTDYRGYKIRRGPGEILSTCILIDPLDALSGWAAQRGDGPGYLFYNISGSTKIKMKHSKPI